MFSKIGYILTRNTDSTETYKVYSVQNSFDTTISAADF
jgi:hypothetical protein